MYGNRLKDGLKPDELEAARLGFNRYLRRKHFSPQFIARHAEELFAQATLEYSRKRAEGVEIDNPPGWLIECAWRRTKSQLEAEARNPRLVALEKVGPLAAKHDEEPEDALLESERYRKLWEAVGKLSGDQRRVLALSYFEGFTVREAGRRLHWHSSKAQRAHERAKDRLHELLGVESVDDLAIEIGLIAYLSLAGRAAGSIQLPAGLEAMAESAHDSAKQLWARAHELLGRFSTGGGGGGIEAAGAAATTDGGGRIAEACKVLVVCVVGGTAALGGNQLIDHERPQPPPTANRAAAHATSTGPLPTSAAGRTGSLGGASSGTAPPTQSGTHQGNESASGPAAKKRSEERQAEAQFGGFAKAGGAEPRADTAASVSSASSSPPPSEASTATSSQAAPAEERQAREQFGAFE